MHLLNTTSGNSHWMSLHTQKKTGETTKIKQKKMTNELIHLVLFHRAKNQKYCFEKEFRFNWMFFLFFLKPFFKHTFLVSESELLTECFDTITFTEPLPIREQNFSITCRQIIGNWHEWNSLSAKMCVCACMCGCVFFNFNWRNCSSFKINFGSNQLNLQMLVF